MKTQRAGLVLLLMLCLSVQLMAQQKSPNPIFTADSLASGNYKDVLNSFFQLGLERLTSPDKEIRIKGTPFAVMAKLDTTLLIDKNYRNYTTLRNLNYAVGLRLDSSFRFNGFTSGITFAIVNKRDETVSKAFLKTVENNERVQQLYAANTAAGKEISKIQDMNVKGALLLELDAFVNQGTPFKSLSPELKEIILKAADEPLRQELNEKGDYNFTDTAKAIYSQLKDDLQKKVLWTVGVTDTTYKDQFVFSNLVLHTQFLKGLTQSPETTHDWELDIKSGLQFVDDTLKSGRDLKRMLFNLETGMNVVFKAKTTKRSYLEIKFSGSYYRNFAQLYPEEERDRLSLNATVRLRVFPEVWVPLEFRYDPENGNFLGFINIRANFTALGSIAKQL
ncbi:hypothetical protein ACQKLP_19085 [Chitinophaga sp. NPDC101104]|uniref:hypothetical protein n=1 Tax=Chitinophaga sp. NPDC101104 TaxID=3390561 RepID=UPI003CFE37C6